MDQARTRSHQRWRKRGCGRRAGGEEAEDEVVDYIDWAASQRVAEGGEGVGAGSFSLEKLDDHVVWGGKVEFALGSVGKVRAWDQKEEAEKVDASGGLADFKRWIVDLQR